MPTSAAAALNARIVTPSSNAMWQDYLRARYRNLYLVYNLPHTCTSSELDHPRIRPGIYQRAVTIDGPEGEPICVAGGRLDLQPDRPQGPAAQLRYFWVEANCRKLGLGRMILENLEDQCRRSAIRHIWMEARVEAVDFYARCGYTDSGPGPTKWDVIPHRIMEKTLP